MSGQTFVVPKAGAGLINLRSAPQLKPETLVGKLGEHMRLELVAEGDAFHAGRVFLSTQVAEVGDVGLVGLRAGIARGNIRLAPRVDDPETDIGDLGPSQSLEFVGFVAEDWLEARVYVAAQATVIVPGDDMPHAMPLADGFDAPVGTVDERASTRLWPGAWVDATGYAVRYSYNTPSGLRLAFHTGADLNLNAPHKDADKLAPCFAPAAGIVRAAKKLVVWGNVVVIEHPLQDGLRVWSRLAHLDSMSVEAKQTVARGQEVGRIGNGFDVFPYHLHYDIARIDLGQQPGDWPGDHEDPVRRDYFDPLLFTLNHRPGPERNR